MVLIAANPSPGIPWLCLRCMGASGDGQGVGVVEGDGGSSSLGEGQWEQRDV